jgi:aspartate kinase
MADPAIVKEPKKISELTFDELRELSYIGASVIHENAVYLARLADLPINVRNVNDPKNTGTMILKEPTKGKGNRDVITGIAGKRDFAVFTIYKSAMTREIGFFRHILSVFEERRIPVDHMPTGIGSVSVVVSGEALAGQNLAEIRADLGKRAEPDSLEMTCDMSLIATVGQGMASKRGVASRLFKSLSEAKISVRMIDQASSETNIIVGVRDGDYRRAVRAIYNEFVV